MTSTFSTLNILPQQHMVKMIMSGEDIDPELIETYEDYQSIYRTRHDMIHAAICDHLNVPWGERAVDEVLQSHRQQLSAHQFYDEVRRQTPDFLGIKNNFVTILEVTVSTDLRARSRKAAKYALLCKILRDCGFDLEYRIFVINPRDVYLNRNDLIRSGLDDLVLDFAKLVCDRTSALLSSVHKLIRGQQFYYRYFEITQPESDVNISPDDVLRTHVKYDNKCFHHIDDLSRILHTPGEITMSDRDNDFLTEMFKEMKNMTPEIGLAEEFNENDFITKMKSMSNSSELRAILPMPYMSTRLIDSSERSTERDWELISMISAKMIDCQNTVINTIGHYASSHMDTIARKPIKTNDDLLFVCKLGQEEKKEVALEGPGRKHFLRQGSTPHLEAEKKHDGYSLSPLVDVEDVHEFSFRLSHKPTMENTGDIIDDMTALSNIKSIGFDYVRLCQTVFREININAMRGDRRHKYVLKPTGADGVYICLYPGTKLRCGELANIVWFKIIIDNSTENFDDDLHGSWIFKKSFRDNQISYTRWLSCDVHRLDHYIRCYDKILMAYTSVVSQQYKLKFMSDESRSEVNPQEASLISQMNKDTSNLLGLIILTYLEDKRTTSKMLQNVRYLVMTNISIFPKVKSTMEKFTEAIRSPLQLYFLKKCLDFNHRMKLWKVSKSTCFGSVKYDYKTHTFLDTFGGSTIELPRPLVSGVKTTADFSEILSEMYFTMLFNKNQDDPTHSSFQVLDKIIEGEDAFTEVKTNGDHLGYRKDMDDIGFARKIVREPHTHQFSAKAIEVGSKLLREKLGDVFADHFVIAGQKPNMNKTLDEFATFKSSSVLDTIKYHPEKNRQNPRRRCLEGVNDLLSEGLSRSYDVVDHYRDEDTFYHVFKKNQIGGVREILILPITNRIRINVLETFSRNLCYFDKREVLTHGVTKNESIKSALYTSKKYEHIRAPIHITLDKSKWGPSFVPIQFIYMFTPFRQKMGNLFNLFVDLLIRHQNKNCVLPDRLVKAWYLDNHNTHHHVFPGLQKLKERFLNDKSLLYKNESNMGQGILHYSSSLLHLCLITFRDKLYDMWCKEMNLNSKDHEDLLSSDDSYTIFCPEISRTDTSTAKVKLIMFLKCQQISEYLFNCRTSKVKSSINPLVGEFNSLFISNMTFVPTLFKYCLASVHPVNTDSFFRMVKESYSSSRQIVENGGGLDLYTLSHVLNKRYAEEIYHTYSGGANDPKQWGLNVIPYHMGYYPVFNPALMLCFGPEYHNFLLFKSHWPKMTDDEKNFFKICHKIIKGGVIETMAEFEEGDTVLGGLLRIEAHTGPIKQLDRIRLNALMTREQISDIIIKDPMIILRKPKTLDEIIFKVTHKLYTTGSKEALKNIAASIYYGRVSASVSANAYYIPNGGVEKTTYSSCMRMLLEETVPTDFESHFRFIYPRCEDYQIFANRNIEHVNHRIRHPLEIQTVQTLVTHKIYTKLSHSVPELLEYKWGAKEIPDNISTKVQRDFDLIKLHYPLIKDTLEETKQQFGDEPDRQTKSVLLLMLKLFSLRDRSFKGVIYGFGSSDITRSYSTLLERNFSNSMSAEIKSDAVYVRTAKSFEKIYCAHNHTILSEFAESKINSNMWSRVSDEELAIFFQDPGVNKTIKKRVFMCAVTNGFIRNSEEWSGKVGIILHYWHKKQKCEDGIYRGNFDITLFMGQSKLNCYFVEKTNTYHFQKTHLDDPLTLKDFFDELATLCDSKIEEMVKKTKKGKWMLVDDKILKTDDMGFDITDRENIEYISFDSSRLEIDENWTRLVDVNGYRIYNTETGLLSCTHHIDPEDDFRVFGLLFSDMMKIGAFNQNFNVLYCPKVECLDILNDVEVPRPKVSDVTKRRLPWTKNWDTASEEKLDEDLVVEDTTESFLEDLINQNFESDEYKQILPNIQEQAESKFEEALQFLLETDVIFSMKTSQRIQHYRRVFLIIKNLKYDLICNMITGGMKVSAMLIKSMRKLLKPEFSENLIYSLISLYDRTYQTEGIKSPEGLTMNIHKDFLNKFQVLSDDEMEF